MTLWYDISTALSSTSMNGTVRTELETCRALQRRHKDLKLFYFYNGQIKQPIEHDYPWLFNLTRPIGEQYLEWLDVSKPQKQGSRASTDVERLTTFANSAAPGRLERGKHSLHYALSMFPPALVEVLLETFGPHSQATYELLRRFSHRLPKRINPWPRAAATQESASHPFRNGDAIFTVGIDWSLTFLPFLKKLKETLNIQVHQVVHDLTPIVVPQFHVQRNCELYREFFWNVSNTADCIWYISAQTEKDGVTTQKNWRLPVSRSKQIRWGSHKLGPPLASPEEQKTLLERRGITRPFFLVVSTIEARKNHETVYRAYRQLVKLKGPEIPQLVFAGHAGWKRSEFVGAIHRDAVVKNHLRHFAPTEVELDALYRQCLFTAYPSLYEGWGLPIVESQSYGKFVLVSDSPSLKEAAGAAGVFVPALSVKAWQEALSKYLFDASALKEATAAQQAALQFPTWEATADQILTGLAS